MTVAEMKELLKDEYGICSMEELEEAVEKSPKLDIGLFVSELEVRECVQNAQ